MNESTAPVSTQSEVERLRSALQEVVSEGHRDYCKIAVGRCNCSYSEVVEALDRPKLSPKARRAVEAILDRVARRKLFRILEANALDRHDLLPTLAGQDEDTREQTAQHGAPVVVVEVGRKPVRAANLSERPGRGA